MLPNDLAAALAWGSAPGAHDGPAVSLDSAGPELPGQMPAGRSPAHMVRPIATPDRSGAWLRNASAGLCVLTAAAAAVSFTAQYRMVYGARHLAVVAGLEAAIPDVAAVVFACLGVALALHGRRAIRARALNVAAVGTSVFMNAMAASPGWRSLAIWAMPPIAYALASDTLIGVVRAWVIARHQALNARLADDETTPLAAVGGLILWLLRLAVAPVSTLAGFRAWVVEECPVAPGRRALRPAPEVTSAPARKAITRARPCETDRGRGRRPPGSWPWPPTGMAHWPAFPSTQVSKLSAELAPQVGLNTGSARAALRQAVLAAQDGDPR